MFSLVAVFNAFVFKNRSIPDEGRSSLILYGINGISLVNKVVSCLY